jgi:hypothetical protein
LKQALLLAAEGDGEYDLSGEGAISDKPSDAEELIKILRRFGAAAEASEQEGYDKSSGQLVDALG